MKKFSLKKLLPNSFKHRLKELLGLLPPPPPPPPEELCEAYEKATPTTWGIARTDLADPPPIPATPETTSQLARQDFFDRPFFQYWSMKIKDHWQAYMNDPIYFLNVGLEPNEIVYHRRLWEFVFIIHSLYERGCLAPRKRGLGFAVGTEPLPAFFAAQGCSILASDLEVEKAANLGWVDGGEHSCNDLAVLNRFGLCPQEDFSRLVSFRNVDMNAIADDLNGFDFCWSTCAFEHLGSIRNGLNFVRNCLKTLKPGGVAVHTTDLNLSSETDTVDDNPYAVIYRKRDIRELSDLLAAEGHRVSPLDFSRGDGPVDSFIDLPPYYRKKMHLKYFNSPYTVTSLGLIIRKAE